MTVVRSVVNWDVLLSSVRCQSIAAAPRLCPTDRGNRSWGIEPWETNTVKAELERRGLKPRADMVGANFKSFHVKDPDGWDLQISNQRDASELGTLTP
jgi:hypothetical protein